jgi:hypothetical protein
VWLLHIIICACSVVITQNTEEQSSRKIIKDILNGSSDSENDIFVNTNSDDCNYDASASDESTHKCVLIVVQTIVFPPFQT